jgi:hypothetical protein
MKKTLLLFLSVAAITVAGAAEFAKLHNCRIIIPDKASAIEKAAAEELKLHLSKSYTCPAKLNGKVPAVINFYVGLNKESGITPKYKGEFGVFRKNDTFLLTGFDTPKGTLTKTTDA